MFKRMVVCALAFMAMEAFAQQASSICGDLPNSFGPYDYRTVRGQELRLVEGAHFPPSVEALLHGKAAKHAPVGPEINYTLHAFPNHHRALLATTRFAERTKKDPPPGMKYTVECWFDRAVRFRRDDTIVRMLYGQYLAGKGRQAEALEQLRSAAFEARDNGFTHYNIGLIYFDIKEPDRALTQAHKAISLGFERTELKDKLVAAGKWTEPAPEKAPEPANSSAPAAPAASEPEAGKAKE